MIKDVVEKLQIFIKDEGSNVDEVMKFVRNVLETSITSSGPGFMYKLYAGSEEFGQVSEFIAACINANAYTFSAAPAFTAIEISLLQQIGHMVFPGLETDGIFTPGGSYKQLI